MKVLLVVTGLSMGGAERLVVDLADALVKSGCEVLIAYLKGPFQVRPRQPEVDVVCLGIESPSDVLSGYSLFLKLLRNFRPDIVHGHMFHATLLVRLARLGAHIPAVISTMHTAYDGGRLKAIAFRATDRLTDISTNVSCEAVEAFVANGWVRADRMLIVHNGISVDEFRAVPEARRRIRAEFSIAPDCTLFVAAGRLSWSKDYPNLFQALALLPPDLDFKLLIAGDGELRPELEMLVGELGLSSRVEFLGVRCDIAELMSAADVFVLSSVGEGFALVVVEAMACECVVVATDCGGVREAFADARFLVPKQDPAALADALLAASALPREEAAELGRAARRRVVDMYSFDRFVDKWHEIYDSLLADDNQPVSAPRSVG